MNTGEASKLLILWTSGDREVALNMLLMYGLNAQRHRWWDQVTLLIWGPSQRLVVEDPAVRSEVQAMAEAGARIMACATCAERYGLTDALRALEIEVFGMGAVLSNWLKSDARVLTL